MTITQETLSWPFKDPEWKNKFIIGSALILAGSLIPLVGLLGIFVVYGYALIIMRAVIRGESPTLPKWDEFGELFVDGLKAGISAIGYMLPGLLAFCCGYLLLFGTIFGGALVSSGTSGRAASNAIGTSVLAGQLGFFCLFAIGSVVIFIGSLAAPLAVANYTRTGEISAGYRVKELWSILRANLGGFVIAWIVYHGLVIALSYVLVFVYFTIILCLLLPIITAPMTLYFTLMWATLFGMAYREGIAKAGLAAVT